MGQEREARYFHQILLLDEASNALRHIQQNINMVRSNKKTTKNRKMNMIIVH